MKLFKRGITASRREDLAYAEAASRRMQYMLTHTTYQDDAQTVETRLRNMLYGSHKR